MLVLKNKVAELRRGMFLSQKEMADMVDIPLEKFVLKEAGKIEFTDMEKIKIRLLFYQVDPYLTIDEIFFNKFE